MGSEKGEEAAARSQGATDAPSQEPRAVHSDATGDVESNNEKLVKDEATAGPATMDRLRSARSNDPNAVDWDGPDDPENPMNWTDKKKWANIGAISVMTLLTPLGSSMFAPGVPDIMQDFNTTNPNLATFVVSVYILGFAFGPLLAAPLSEMYGRSICYNVSNTLFVVFTVCTALSQNMGMIIAFRFLMGFAGSTPITNGSGSIADMFPIEQRGRAMSIWAMGPLLGPCFGPVVGGYVVEYLNWRWVFWLIAIAGGVIGFACFFLVKETCHQVLLRKKVHRIHKSGENPYAYSILDDKSLTQKARFQIAILRPMRMLFTLAPIFILSLYVAAVYGVLYLLFSTFTFVYAEQYGFSQGTIGLSYLPTGIGMFLGVMLFGWIADLLVKRKQAKNIAPVPEDRLPIWLTLSFGLIIPASLFWYGWSAEKGAHWIVPMIATSFFSFGLMGVMMSVQVYLVDAYIKFAASVVAAMTVLRSLGGALLPLAGLSMYDSLGLGWGNSVLAFVALAMVPVPIIFRFFGSRIRNNSQMNV